MDQQKIGQFIQARRKALGLTQQQLADKIGVTNKAVSKWELGRSVPDVGLFEALCRELGVSLPELLAGHEIVEQERQSAAEQLLMESISAGKLVGLEMYLYINSVLGVLLTLSPLLFHPEKPLVYLLVGFGVLEGALAIYFDCTLPGKETRRRSFTVRIVYAVCLFLTIAIINYPKAVQAGVPLVTVAALYGGACLMSLLISWVIHRFKQ